MIPTLPFRAGDPAKLDDQQGWITTEDGSGCFRQLFEGAEIRITFDTQSRGAFEHVLAVDGRPEAGLRPLVAQRYVKTRH